MDKTEDKLRPIIGPPNWMKPGMYDILADRVRRLTNPTEREKTDVK